MIDETIILLTYYYDQEDCNHKILRHIIKGYCPAYLPWNLYLYEPLQKIFSKVILYDYLKRRAEIGIEAMNEEIISLARKERPNMFSGLLFTMMFNSQLWKLSERMALQLSVGSLMMSGALISILSIGLHIWITV